jgi:hypothetical protein
MNIGNVIHANQGAREYGYKAALVAASPLAGLRGISGLGSADRAAGPMSLPPPDLGDG